MRFNGQENLHSCGQSTFLNTSVTAGKKFTAVRKLPCRKTKQTFTRDANLRRFGFYQGKWQHFPKFIGGIGFAESLPTGKEANHEAK